MTVFFRDLLIGGPNRDALLQMRRLEPGIRECYAVVIMPSFVPHATFNVSSNWFKIKNPKCKELDSTDAMRLSRLVKNIQNCAPKVEDAACYRDGDYARLLQKGKQLEARLPLEDTMVQIPYENTLGGFAMFNTGVTDLAPELTGWYGSEAIDPTGNTTLFLVGNHFSVHQTSVIAGGQDLGTPTMLSRQVIEVSIGPNPMLVGDSKQQFVDVQLATPYGVSQHLLIPAVAPPAGGASANAIAWQTPSIDLAFVYAGLGIAQTTPPSFRPLNLLLSPGTTDPTVYDLVDVTLDLGKELGGKLILSNNPYNSDQSGYTVSSSAVSSQVFATAGSLIGPQATDPATFITASAKVVFRSSTNAAAPKKGTVANPLTINFLPAAAAGKSATDK